MKKLKCSVYFLFAVLLLSSSCAKHEDDNTVNGIINLDRWDFKSNPIITVKGQYQFYWKEFLSSGQFDSIPEIPIYKTSNNWNGYSWNGDSLPGKGYASYRFIIINSEKHKLSIKTHAHASNSFYAFVNGKKVGQLGKPGKTHETTIPQYISKIIDLPLKDTIDVVFWVANFDYWKGGIGELKIGLKESIYKKLQSSLIYDGIFFGGYLMIFILFIIIYFFRKNEKKYLHFSLWSLMLALRVASTNETIISHLFSYFSWEWIEKFEIGALYAIVSISMLNLKYLFKKQFLPKLYPIIIYAGYLLFAFTILLPSSINSYSLNIGKPLAIFVFSFALVQFIYISLTKQEDYLIISTGFLICLMGSVNEILNTAEIYWLDYNIFNIENTFIIFFIFLVVIHSKQYMLEFKKSQELSNQLAKHKEALEETVEQRTKELKFEKEKSDKLLLNILPEPIAERLKEGEKLIADHYEDVSIVFIDIVDFTLLSSKIPAQHTVDLLNQIFTQFDYISEKYGLEKIKTIGDSYMAAAGIPVPDPHHAQNAANFALEALEAINNLHIDIKVRIGMDCGPIVAGVIGEKKFIYDLWGDSVNTAAKMEEYSSPGEIHVTERFKTRLEEYGLFKFKDNKTTDIKGKGLMKTWKLNQDLVTVDQSYEK